MGRLYRVIVFVCFVLVLGLPQANLYAQTSQGGLVSEILIEGNQRIEAETVLSYLQIKEGDAFDNRKIDRSLKSLFSRSGPITTTFLAPFVS